MLPFKKLRVRHCVPRRDLTRNAITELAPGCFNDNVRLTELSIGSGVKSTGASNRITSLPVGIFERNTELRKLALDSNVITMLPPSVFATTTKLVKIDLSSNRLRELRADAFANLKKLKDLWLGANDLQCQGFTSGLSAPSPNVDYHGIGRPSFANISRLQCSRCEGVTRASSKGTNESQFFVEQTFSGSTAATGDHRGVACYGKAEIEAIYRNLASLRRPTWNSSSSSADLKARPPRYNVDGSFIRGDPGFLPSTDAAYRPGADAIAAAFDLSVDRISSPRSRDVTEYSYEVEWQWSPGTSALGGGGGGCATGTPVEEQAVFEVSCVHGTVVFTPNCTGDYTVNLYVRDTANLAEGVYGLSPSLDRALIKTVRRRG